MDSQDEFRSAELAAKDDAAGLAGLFESHVAAHSLRFYSSELSGSYPETELQITLRNSNAADDLAFEFRCVGRLWSIAGPGPDGEPDCEGAATILWANLVEWLDGYR